MDFRTRLSLLGSPHSGGSGTPPPSSAADSRGRGRAPSAPGRGSDADALSPIVHADPPSKVEALDLLRQKMDQILGRTTEKSQGGWGSEPRELQELPFWLEERDGGTLCVFRETLPLSYRVGRLAVSAGRQACPELLSLLALDPALAACSAKGALFFDLETTGLSGAAVLPFLVGLASYNPHGELVLEQLFLRTPADEPAMLAYLSDRLEGAELLVSFNGRSFDWPLIQTRYVMQRMTPPEQPPHLDLLSVGRRLHRRRIGSCRLTNVEREVLGFAREGDIDGADVAPRYGHYLRTGDEDALSAVVEHNRWDVASMAALLGLYGQPFDVGWPDPRGVSHEPDPHDGREPGPGSQNVSERGASRELQTEGLAVEDWASLAETFKRAKDLERAARTADRAVIAGAGNDALMIRAKIAKARGDRAQAIRDFETLAEAVGDPAVRLELAKLYEHFLKDPKRAREITLLGTGEDAEALTRRTARLTRKLNKLGRMSGENGG